MIQNIIILTKKQGKNITTYLIAYTKKGANPVKNQLLNLLSLRFNLFLVEKVNSFWSSLDNRSGFLVFLLNDDERPDSLFVLTNDIAVFKPAVKGEAINKRIIAFSFIFAPALGNLLSNKIRGTL